MSHHVRYTASAVCLLVLALAVTVPVANAFQQHVAFTNVVAAGVVMLVAFLAVLISHQTTRKMMRMIHCIIINLANFVWISGKNVTTSHGRSVGIAGESAGQYL